jgi:hypothetical protein
MTVDATTDPPSPALPSPAVSSWHCARRPRGLPRPSQPAAPLPPRSKSTTVKGKPGLSTPFFEGHGSGARRMSLGIAPPYARPTSAEKEPSVRIEQGDVAAPRFRDRRSPLARVKRALAVFHEFKVRPTR